MLDYKLDFDNWEEYRDFYRCLPKPSWIKYHPFRQSNRLDSYINGKRVYSLMIWEDLNG